MPAETQTGMDRAEMKRFLIKSKQEPVNCALGVGEDKSVALLILSPIKSAKSLQGELQKQFPSAFNTRFGVAVVDTDDDPTLVKFMLNKAVTSMARRLVKTLKGTGFRKVQILLEDGSPVEIAAEEEGVAPASPASQNALDAAALTAALAELVQRIATVADATQKEALAKRAREANVNVKVGSLTYAAAGIESLRRALDALVTPAGSKASTEAPNQSAPPPPPPETVAARPDAAALTAALAQLAQRVAGIADPAQKEALAKQAREANVNIKTGNLSYAATGIESLRQTLDSAAPVTASLENEAPPPPENQEAKPATAVLAKALTELVQRIGGVTDPTQKDALAKQAREVNVNIKTGNFISAATGIESLRQMLDAVAAPRTPGDQMAVRPKASAVQRALAEFDAAKATVDEQIAELQRKLSGNADPDLKRIGEFGLNALTGNTKVKLQAAMIELRGGMPAIDPAVAAKAAHLAEQMAAFLSEDAKVRACDNNPFDVAVSIKTTLGGAARRLQEVLRQTS